MEAEQTAELNVNFYDPNARPAKRRKRLTKANPYIHEDAVAGSFEGGSSKSSPTSKRSAYTINQLHEYPHLYPLGLGLSFDSLEHANSQYQNYHDHQYDITRYSTSTTATSFNTESSQSTINTEPATYCSQDSNKGAERGYILPATLNDYSKYVRGETPSQLQDNILGGGLEQEQNEPQTVAPNNISHVNIEPATTTGVKNVDNTHESLGLGQQFDLHLPAMAPSLPFVNLDVNTRYGATLMSTLSTLHHVYHRTYALAHKSSTTLQAFRDKNDDFFVDGKAQAKSHKASAYRPDTNAQRRTTAAVKASREKKAALEKEDTVLRKKIAGYIMLKEIVWDVIAELGLQVKFVKKIDAIGIRLCVEHAISIGMDKMDFEAVIFVDDMVNEQLTNAVSATSGAVNVTDQTEVDGDELTPENFHPYKMPLEFHQARRREIQAGFEQQGIQGGVSKVSQADRNLIEVRAPEEVQRGLERIEEVQEMLEYVMEQLEHDIKHL